MKIARTLLRSPGGLMTFIATLAVLMAFHEHRRREIELDTVLSSILLDLSSADRGQFSVPGTSSNSGYFEYGDDVEEARKMEEPMNPPPRPGRRWTLGGLMLVVALSSLPMAWYVQEAARQRAAVEARKAAVAHAWALAAGRKGNPR